MLLTHWFIVKFYGIAFIAPFFLIYRRRRQGDDGSIGPIGSTRMPDAVTHHSCIKSQTEYELSLILKEIRFITDQVRHVKPFSSQWRNPRRELRGIRHQFYRFEQFCKIQCNFSFHFIASFLSKLSKKDIMTNIY